MNYKNALQVIDPSRALGIMKMNQETSGAYIKFDSLCGHKALVKTFGDKKNLWYCPDCKTGGNIISLYIKQMGVQYDEAVRQLVELAGTTQAPITDELSLNYELQYLKGLEKLDISEEFCKEYGIGQPKGKTMLSGCLAFTVKNEEGMKVAYYGINLNSLKNVFHKSFNPELYLFNIDKALKAKKAVVVNSLLTWIAYESTGTTAVCNFGLPYLSAHQLKLLGMLDEFEFDSSFMAKFAIDFFNAGFIPTFKRDS